MLPKLQAYSKLNSDEVGEVLGGALAPTDEARLAVVGDGAVIDALPCTDSLMQDIMDRLPKAANPTA